MKHLPETKVRAFLAGVLGWHKSNRQEFAWRNTTDPFRILTAELLLRKTRRTQVNRIYEEFIEAYPDASSLANSNLKKLQKRISKLGLARRRATQLREMGKVIADNHDGIVPCTRRDLLKLPGVGEYAADSVLCLAFGKQVVMLDTNMIRVIGRFFSAVSERSRPRNDPSLRASAKRILARSAREVNLAVLDFADAICRARVPLCSTCPVRSNCDYYGGTGYWRSRNTPRR